MLSEKQRGLVIREMLCNSRKEMQSGEAERETEGRRGNVGCMQNHQVSITTSTQLIESKSVSQEAGR